MKRGGINFPFLLHFSREAYKIECFQNKVEAHFTSSYNKEQLKCE